MKNWEYSMTSAMRVAMNQNKFDTLNLYIKLESAAKKYLASGEMKEGDSFKVPLEDGAFLKQSFYNDYSVLNLINTDKTESVVISKEDSFEKEYRFLLGYERALKNSELGIGTKYPEKFAGMLQSLKSGEVITFDNGRSYVCESNAEGLLKLVKQCNTNKVPHISEFANSESISVNLYNNIHIQWLYSAMRDNYNDDVRFRTSTSTKTQELLNSLIAGLDHNKVKLLHLGPNTIRVKKSWMNKSLSYYDENGKKIPESQVKALIGWLNTAPVVTEYVRSADKITDKTKFDDDMVRENADILFGKKEFSLAAQFIGTYCMDNKGSLEVKMSSYVENEGDFKAVSFLFKYEAGQVRIFKAEYEENDYSKEPSSLKEVGFKEFEAFCQSKYDDNYVHIQNRVKLYLLDNYPQYNNDKLTEISNLIMNKVEKENRVLKVQTEELRKDVDALIESLDEDLDGRDDF